MPVAASPACSIFSQVDAGRREDERGRLGIPAQRGQATDQAPAVRRLGREEDHVRVEVEQLGRLGRHAGGCRQDRHAQELQTGPRVVGVGRALGRAGQDVQGLLLQVVEADDAGRGVRPRHADAGSVDVLGEVVHRELDHPRHLTDAGPAGTDGVDALGVVVGGVDRHRGQAADACGLEERVDGLREEVEPLEHEDRLLPCELVGAPHGVGRVDGHEAGLELDRPPWLPRGPVGADPAELLVDELDGRLHATGELGEGARRVTLGVLEPDQDRVALGLQRLLGGTGQHPRRVAGPGAEVGVDGVVGLARAVARFAPGSRGGRAGCRCRGARRGRGGHPRRRRACRCGVVVVAAAAGRQEEGEARGDDRCPSPRTVLHQGPFPPTATRSLGTVAMVSEL